MAETVFDKIWRQHVILGEEGEPQLLYVDLHLVHEVTSPHGFESLRENNRPVRRPDKTFATVDHNVPTSPTPVNSVEAITDRISRLQVETLQKNCRDFGIKLATIGTQDQGIVHVIGPQLGLSQPGRLIVCGD